MQERDTPSAGPEPRLLIDQAISRGLTAVERDVEIGDAVADVMDARPTLRQELGHGTCGIAGLEQLDVHRTETQTDDPGAIGGLRPSRGESQYVAVEG